jgi:hypothetical protein
MGSLKRDCEDEGENKDKFCFISSHIRTEEEFKSKLEKVQNMKFVEILKEQTGLQNYKDGYGNPVWYISGYATGHLKTPALQYSVDVQSKPSRPGCWDVLDVTVKKNGEKVGEYGRNYCSFGKSTFAPFVYKGKEYALYSKDYTATRVMTLPDCKDLCGEESNGHGFCPTEYYVPVNPFTGECPGFAFLAGCVWGDDSSWKIQFLDLSKLDEGIIKREEKFGYIELPRDMNLKDAIDISWDENNFDNYKHVEITITKTFDLETGKSNDL